MNKADILHKADFTVLGGEERSRELKMYVYFWPRFKVNILTVMTVVYEP